jgi:hypothetical protein
MSLGEIKHIEINGKVAYILYEFYFSAVLAFNILSQTVTKNNLKQLFVKLIKKEDDGEAKVSEAKSEEPGHNIRSMPFGSVLIKLDDSKPTEKKIKEKEDKLRDTPATTNKFNLPFLNNYGIQLTDIASISPINEDSVFNLRELTEEAINPSFLFNYKYNSISEGAYSQYFTKYDDFNISNMSFNNNESQPYAHLKYVCNYEVQIENDDKFRVTKRLIGVKGVNVKKVLYDSCSIFKDNTTKLRLRGKGSGYREGINNQGKIVFNIRKR